jgi:transcriptional regulator with XRE-family HTH domain
MARKELLAITGRLDLTPAKLADLLGVSRSLASKLTGGEDARSLKGGGAVLLRLLDARPDLVRVLEAGRYIPGDRAAPEPTFGEDQRLIALLASVAGDPAVFAELVADVPEAGDPHRLHRFVERGYVTLDDGVPTVSMLGNVTFRSQDVVGFWREVGCNSPRETPNGGSCATDRARRRTGRTAHGDGAPYAQAGRRHRLLELGHRGVEVTGLAFRVQCSSSRDCGPPRVDAAHAKVRLLHRDDEIRLASVGEVRVRGVERPR